VFKHIAVLDAIIFPIVLSGNGKPKAVGGVKNQIYGELLISAGEVQFLSDFSGIVDQIVVA
jgi:hypothetical protein